MNSRINPENNKKFGVLCIPLGGLNDTLYQIYTCWKFCQLNNNPIRSLYIADNFSQGTYGLLQEVFNFDDGDPEDVKVYYLSQGGSFNLKPVDSYNRTFPYHLHQNKQKLVEEVQKIISFEKPPLRLPLSLATEVDLAVHISWGSGDIETDFLKKLEPRPKIKEALRKQMGYQAKVPKDFIGVHARNTDNKIRNNWKKLISNLQELQSENPILICSDDRRLIDFALNLPGSTYFTVGGNVPYLDGFLSLHQMTAAAFRDKPTAGTRLLIKQLLDLIYLSKCCKIYTLKSNEWSDGISGFVKLAVALKKTGAEWLH